MLLKTLRKIHVSVSRFSKMQSTLPAGKHDLQLYSVGTPNGLKISCMLEELGVAYDAWRIDIRKGDQFSDAFVKCQPNSKIPLLVDRSVVQGGFPIFESGAILQYLGNKYSSPLYPKETVSRSLVEQWLFWKMSTAPYLGGGGFGHFTKYAPKDVDHSYAIERYTNEAKRILKVLDDRLGLTKAYVAGNYISIADIALFTWMKTLQLSYNGNELLEMDKLKHIVGWMETLEQRPGIQRGLRVLAFDSEEEHYSTDGL